MKNSRGKSAARCFLKQFFSHSRKIFVIALRKGMISLARKISYSLSANHYPELRWAICTGVAGVLH